MANLITLKQFKDAEGIQSPKDDYKITRIIDSVSQLVKTLSDTNKDLLELQRKIKVINKDIQEGPKTVNNSLYVGNTAELQKFINKRKDSE